MTPARWLATPVLGALCLMLTTPGCAPPAKNGEPGNGSDSPGSSEPDYAVVRVLYGTDRDDTGADHPRDKYGVARGDGISWGQCEVSIPRDHRMGELEEPSIWRLEFREDPEKHVVLLDGVRYDRDEFVAALAGATESSRNRSVLVFVHGYNVTFEDAARRTAQLKYDLGFGGAATFFSWPSNGSKAAYAADEADIQWSTPHIREFLETVATADGVGEVFVVAHSMGNRGVTRALIDLEPEARSRIREVVLTAPDIDADVFVRDLLPRLGAEGSRLTLYASSNDLALQASKRLHQGRRAGEAGPELIVAEGLDTIDASSVETSFLGHSYFAEERSLLSDLYYLLTTGSAPDERAGLEREELAGQPYWRFRD